MQLQKNKSLLPKTLSQIQFEPKLLVKGCLFYPFSEWNQKSRFNPFNQGWWLELREVEEARLSLSTYSIIQSKLDWIFPYKFHFDQYNFDEVQEKCNEILSHSNELMIVRWDKDKLPIDRGFIMRKAWPNYV